MEHNRTIMIELPAQQLNQQGLRPLQPVSPAKGPYARLREYLSRRVIILSRDLTYYTEETVSLNRPAELRSYLQANASLLCPFAGWQAVFLATKQEAVRGGKAGPRTRLKIWFYDPQYLSQRLGPHSCLLLPEDMLIAAQSRGKTLFRVNTGEGQGYLLFASNGEIRSNQFVPPAESETFLLEDIRSLAEIEPQTLGGQARQAAIRRGLVALGWRNLAGLFHRGGRRVAMSPQAVRRGLAYAASVATLWLLAGSAVLLYQQRQLEQQQAGMSEQLRAALTANTREQALLEQYDVLLPLYTETPSLSRLFQALQTLPLEQSRITRIRLAGDQILINGDSSSASALLATVSAQPWVADAHFTGPVSRRQEREHFSLQLQVDPQRFIAGIAEASH